MRENPIRVLDLYKRNGEGGGGGGGGCLRGILGSGNEARILKLTKQLKMTFQRGRGWGQLLVLSRNCFISSVKTKES